MNLIINAAEAIGETMGIVTISTGVEGLSAWKLADMTFGRDAIPGTYAFLEVHDNRPGTDVETLARIFTPFFTTKQSGHGLGLAAVQGIVRGHHGALGMDSAVVASRQGAAAEQMTSERPRCRSPAVPVHAIASVRTAPGSDDRAEVPSRQDTPVTLMGAHPAIRRMRLPPAPHARGFHRERRCI